MSEKHPDCNLLGFATHVSWQLNLSETDAIKIAAIAEQWTPYPEEGTAWFKACESPAERLFLLGFMLGEAADSISVDFDPEPKPAHPDQDSCTPALLSIDGRDFWLWQQVHLDKYRTDFVITHPWVAGLKAYDWVLVIEIDGHDFHERTKEQAAADRSRDRDLTRRGFRVIRYTGSEVYRDPRSCVTEALTIAAELERRRESISKRVEKAYENGLAEGERSALEMLTASPTPKQLPAPKAEAAE